MFLRYVITFYVSSIFKTIGVPHQYSLCTFPITPQFFLTIRECVKYSVPLIRGTCQTWVNTHSTTHTAIAVCTFTYSTAQTALRTHTCAAHTPSVFSKHIHIQPLWLCHFSSYAEHGVTQSPLGIHFSLQLWSSTTHSLSFYWTLTPLFLLPKPSAWALFF